MPGAEAGSHPLTNPGTPYRITPSQRGTDMYIHGDDYVAERRDAIMEQTKLHARMQQWSYLFTGGIAGAYAVFGHRWLLATLVVATGITILHAIETIRIEQLFIMSALEHRARLIEGRTEGISAMVERMDRGKRGFEPS